MIAIEVTDNDIFLGRPCDMDYCPVAIALERATGEPCRVFSQNEGPIIIEVGSFCIEAPEAVEDFVVAFDDYDGNSDDDSIADEERPLEISPFVFEIPDLDSPAWAEQCLGCHMLFAPDELNDYGFCEDCLEE